MGVYAFHPSHRGDVEQWIHEVNCQAWPRRDLLNDTSCHELVADAGTVGTCAGF